MLGDVHFTQRRLLCIGAAGIVVLWYVLLLYWFESCDFYHSHFFDRGLVVDCYQCARLIFIFYFCWLVYAVGAATTRIVVGADEFAMIPARERVPLRFLVGVATWSVLLFPLGLAGLYSRALAFAVTIVVNLASIPHLADCIEAGVCALARARMSGAIRVGSAIRRNFICVGGDDSTSRLHQGSNLLVKWLVWIAIALAVTMFLLVKGLYPGGGHDYYDHYFPYYLRVIQTGSILPNDVWYHFYVSKGDGLYFLAMLLTDPLAPQLVTAGFILCAAAIVYALLRRIARTGVLPWIGVLLYVAFFIYTPGPQYFMVRGGWGDLEKEHELTAVLVLGVIWCVIQLSKTSNNKPWILGLHASIVATILITLQLGLLIGVYLTGFMFWFAVQRQWRKAAIPFFGGVTAAISMIVILAINYYLTGLVLDQAILFTWPIINLAKIAQWGALFELLTLDKHMFELSANVTSWPQTIVWLLPCFLRLEIWWPLVATASVFAVYRIVSSRDVKSQLQSSATRATWALLWFSGVVAVTAMFGGGRSQVVTFYRISSFAYAPTFCMGLALWHFGLCEGSFGSPRAIRMGLGGVVIALLLTGIGVVSAGMEELKNIDDNVGDIVRNDAGLWAGRYSIADAYQNQQGWPGRMPWGGIYPGLLQAWQLLPPFTRVWSFHIYTYCMLPDCNFEGYLSFVFSPQWRTVYFGSPERARAALKGEGLDYFFFSKTMEIDDPIGHAPLFSSTNVAKYLAIRWTDGTNYLLTWPGPKTCPLDDAFLSAYGSMTEKSDTYREFDVEQWKALANEITAQETSGKKLHPFPLPWCSSLMWCFSNR